jgi:hypothetical protein
MDLWLAVGFIDPTLNAFIYAGRLDGFKKSWTALYHRFKKSS